ncbi:MAG: transcriptional regulator [Desulfovibrionaceae bacterium]|nr:transcriptional regulator [Desulfovibrionaceae bacterium]MBF0512807.1 transcriptional regulator [Desulfovibrionaceae bacterium]
MSLTRDYRADLIKDLRSPVEAAQYINAVLEDGDPEALALALRDVALAGSLQLPREESEALCRLKTSLEKAGLRVTITVS